MWARKPWVQPAESAADQDRGAVPVGVGDLCEGLVEDGDVVGGGVRPGPALAQQPGQGFAGVVQEAEQRVVAERLLPGRGRRFLLGVADHDRGVDVQDQARDRPAGRRRPAAGRRGSRRAGPRRPPGPGPGPRAAGQQSTRPAAASSRHAVGSDATGPNKSAWSRSTARSEMASPPSASITARSTAIRPGSCPLPLPQPGEARRRTRRSARSHRPDRPAAGRRHDRPPPPVSGHDDLRTCSGSLHPASAFRDGMT